MNAHSVVDFIAVILIGVSGSSMLRTIEGSISAMTGGGLTITFALLGAGVSVSSGLMYGDWLYVWIAAGLALIGAMLMGYGRSREQFGP